MGSWDTSLGGTGDFVILCLALGWTKWMGGWAIRWGCGVRLGGTSVTWRVTVLGAGLEAWFVMVLESWEMCVESGGRDVVPRHVWIFNFHGFV